ncbi:hypothetical protein PR202_gb22753 [Eleusine coracana subsp. coracana]|uniref:RING-type E3 ubiquitin transferase n=1 Tax=Eleusine coracana subsp. coracana TaxID=191504 RepID=A0AAV5FGM4_ELECO|nr:hypothetical protein QOZ80_6AG0534000 [Eleusine coracana subsp. coracana]GJN34112.1 hypothetical protein PR202_gb22753 [Eleusine coracana subsp. coracana]
MPPPPNQPKRRRLLTLPAVYPCESIAPAPLLASLLSLAADLASRGDFGASFPVLQRGVRHAVRVAGLLLAFLEEIQDATMMTESLPQSAVLSLTELHVAMQKLRFLLTDLARRGARLWVLVNAGLAASELRAALGSVAAAMDVLVLLPRDGSVVDGSVEAVELARMVSDQAWRAVVWPDAGDERAARSVRSILEQFKCGVSPDAEDVRRVLGRVGVRTWSDCSEEIAFLEDELRIRSSDEDGGSEAVVVNSLVAFLVYCRVVLFDHIIDARAVDHPTTKAAAARCPDWIRPDALQCPITLDLMTDPVTVSTGQTYDRASIARWLRAGCRTCPVTGERLRTSDLVPNAALRGIIGRLLRTNGVSLPDHAAGSHRHGALGDTAVTLFGLAAAGAARLAVAYVVAQLRTGSTAERRKATAEARKMSKHSAFYRASLVDANAVPWLLCLLSSTDASVQDNAVAALLNLSKHPRGRAALFEAGGVGLVVDVVNVGARADARHNAAAVLFYLSSNAEQAEEIGRVPEAVPTLVQLVRDGAHRGRKNAMVSLYGLLQSPANHAKAVAAGVVPALAALLLHPASSADPAAADDDGGGLAGDAVTLLARLAEQPTGAMAVLARPGLVARVAEVLATSSSRSGKDHCVALLVSLCRHGGDRVVALLGRMPGLMPALYALIADGNAQTCKRARALLNLIHRHYELTHPSAAPASDPGERVVRVL